LCQAWIPDEVPKVKDEVPEGLIVVHLAAELIPNNLATLSFSSLTILAASFKSNFCAAPDPIPVIPTPIKAS
jgi:hypothetical protein